VGKVKLEIDGKEVVAEEGMTVLEAARLVGAEIPTLCHDERLEPYGACRVCTVEIERGGKTRMVAACGFPVENGLKVRTRSPRLDRMRKTLIELAAVSAGEWEEGSKFWTLVREYGADPSRFASRVQIKPTKCIVCGLCVRTCSDVTGDGVIGFVGRGINRRVVIFPEKAQNCWTCRYCQEVCPTGKISPAGPLHSFPSIDDVLAGRV